MDRNIRPHTFLHSRIYKSARTVCLTHRLSVMMDMEDNGNCGSSVYDDTSSATASPSPSRSPPAQSRRLPAGKKFDVYSEILRRLRHSSSEEAMLPGFDEELWNHFNRLPTRYASLRPSSSLFLSSCACLLFSRMSLVAWAHISGCEFFFYMLSRISDILDRVVLRFRSVGTYLWFSFLLGSCATKLAADNSFWSNMEPFLPP